jgi:hypothetical protein
MKKGNFTGITPQNISFFQFIQIHQDILEDIIKLGVPSKESTSSPAHSSRLTNHTVREPQKKILIDNEHPNPIHIHSKHHKPENHLLLIASQKRLQKRRFSQSQIFPSPRKEEDLSVDNLLAQIEALNKQIQTLEQSQIEKEQEHNQIVSKLKSKNHHKSLKTKDLNNQINERDEQIISFEMQLKDRDEHQ